MALTMFAPDLHFSVLVIYLRCRVRICANPFFRPVKNAEEETELIENATPKSTREVAFENIFPWKGRMVEKKIQYSSLASSQLTSRECKASTLL